MLSIIIITISN